jgi:dTDP-4-dehydrorhamnose reductase
MAQTPLIITGLNGLVGSRLRELFESTYDFTNLDITHPTTPVDITNQESVMAAVKDSPAQFIIHFAAYTDVTGAWKQDGDKSGPAYQVNVIGTENLVAAAEKYNKHFIHISTAYVFDGDNPNPYVETDTPHPIEWYGQTKLLAEEAVQRSGTPWTILRIDQPFRSTPAPRPDVVRRMVESMKDDTLYPQFTDHHFGPTFIDDFARIIDWVIRTNTTGLYHATNNESWTDFAFAQEVAKRFAPDYEVKPGNLAEYLETSQRPYQANTALNSEKLHDLLDFEVTSIVDALSQVQL